VALRHGGELVAPGTDVTGSSIDLVFPVLHGPGGEDGTVQGVLDTLGVPYVGAGVAASALGMDKSLQKPVFAQAGIPVTPWIALTEAEVGADKQAAVRRAQDAVGLPAFTKPAGLGSSVGVSKCKTLEELLHGIERALVHDHTILVEQAVHGRELECAVLGNEDPEASVVGEVVPAHEFYDYEAKYLIEGSELIIPARIPDAAAEQIKRFSVQAFKAIGCSGMARVDFFLSGDRVLLNEINTIPGFTPISMYPKLWEASGIPYAKLIDRLIELALERHQTRRR
jgi:D-alanine-D-alanine ligase